MLLEYLFPIGCQDISWRKWPGGESGVELRYKCLIDPPLDSKKKEDKLRTHAYLSTYSAQHGRQFHTIDWQAGDSTTVRLSEPV